MTDWPAWHSHYDDPEGTLTRRLGVVRRRIGETLASFTAGPPCGILSLCAGDGRDILPQLAASGRAHRTVLVEKDRSLAGRAVATATQLGLDGVTVIVGDAGLLSTFAQHLPVDLLLLCGIFGNISEDDIRATVAAAPGMLRPGGTVIWTRGAAEPDLRAQIRAWFVAAGLSEVAFDSEPEGFGVGVGRLAAACGHAPGVPGLLFTFVR